MAETRIANLTVGLKPDVKDLLAGFKKALSAGKNWKTQSLKNIKELSRGYDQNLTPQIKALELNLKRLNKAGKKGSTAHKVAVMQLRKAYDQLSKSTQRVKKSQALVPLRSGGQGRAASEPTAIVKRSPTTPATTGGGGGSLLPAVITGGMAAGGTAKGLDFLKTGLFALLKAIGPILAGLIALQGVFRVLKTAVVGSFQAAKQFEAEFQTVKAITSDTGGELANLQSIILDVASATGLSNSQLIKASEVLGRAGFAAGEIGPQLQTVADLATASGMSVSEAANISVRMLKSFGLSLEELPVIADMLATAAANANVSIQSLGEGFKFTGAIAETAGLEFSDVTTALSLLGETGLEAGLAGRALQAMIMDLSKPTDQARKKLFQLGIITHDAAGDMLPLSNILGQLKDANMSTADSFEIFNRNSARAVTALTRNVDKFEAFQKVVESTSGAIDDQAGTIRDSFTVQAARMKQGITALGKELGDVFLPILKDVASFAADMAESIRDVIRQIQGFGKIQSGDFTPKRTGLAAQLVAPGATGGKPGRRGEDRREEGARKRAADIAAKIDPEKLFKDAMVLFEDKLMLAVLEGTELDLDVDATLKSIFSTMLTNLKSEADGTALTTDMVFKSVKEAFGMAKESGIAAAHKIQQDHTKELIFRTDQNSKTRKAEIDANTDYIDGLIKAKDKQLQDIKKFYEGLGQELMNQLGKVGGTIQNAMQAFKTGGPIAALMSVIADLVFGSEGMANLLESLDGVFSIVSEVMTPFLNTLVPLVQIFTALTPVFKLLGQIIEFHLKPVLYAVGLTMLIAFSVIAGIYNVIASILNIFGAGLEIIDIQGAFHTFFDGMKNANSEVDDTTESFRELNRAMVGVAGLPDAIKLNLIAFRSALSDLTEVVDILGGGSGPQGMAHGGQVHHFANGGIVPGSGNQDSVPAMLTPGEMVIPKGMVAANGTTVVINNMVVKVTDVKDFMKKLTNAQEWRSMARSGTPGGRGLMGAK